MVQAQGNQPYFLMKRGYSKILVKLYRIRHITNFNYENFPAAR